MSDHRDSFRSSSEGSEIEALDVRVPLLRLKGSSWDAVALETWLEALSGLLAPELPHDLMALWVYPPEGPAVLVGPSALGPGQSRSADARPAPRAGRALHHGAADPDRRLRVGRLHGRAPRRPRRRASSSSPTFATLATDLPEAVLLRNVADSLGPTLARVARQGREPLEPPREDGSPPPPERRRSEPGRKLVELHALLAKLGLAESASRTPREFSEFVSQALQPMLPHDRIQILVPDASAQEHYRFDRHGPGTFWSDPALVVTKDQFDPAALFGDADEILVGDTSAQSGHAAWCPDAPGQGRGEPPGARGHRRAAPLADAGGGLPPPRRQRPELLPARRPRPAPPGGAAGGGAGGQLPPRVAGAGDALAPERAAQRAGPPGADRRGAGHHRACRRGHAALRARGGQRSCRSTGWSSRFGSARRTKW